MEITIKSEHTGLNDHFDVKNIITKSIEDKGYKDVFINGNEWYGKKKILFGLLYVKRRGRISKEALNITYRLSLKKCDKDTIVKLDG